MGREDSACDSRLYSHPQIIKGLPSSPHPVLALQVPLGTSSEATRLLACSIHIACLGQLTAHKPFLHGPGLMPVWGVLEMKGALILFWGSLEEKQEAIETQLPWHDWTWANYQPEPSCR